MVSRNEKGSKMMTENKINQLIIDRAKELSKNEIVKSKMKEMYLSGKTIEEIQNHVYTMAIATLYGRQANSAEVQ